MTTIDAILHTGGNGLWSDCQRDVRVTGFKVPYVNKEKTFGELRVYFDTATWSTREHGLIYTDMLFIEELREFLDWHGLAGYDISYSEQGMQGRDYVSFDIGVDFLKSYFDVDKVAS